MTQLVYLQANEMEDRLQILLKKLLLTASKDELATLYTSAIAAGLFDPSLSTLQKLARSFATC